MKRLASVFALALFFLILTTVSAKADGVQYVLKGNPVWNPECYCNIFSNFDGKLICEAGRDWRPPEKDDLVVLEVNKDGEVEICGFVRIRGGFWNDTGWIQKKYLRLDQPIESQYIKILGYWVYKNPAIVGQNDTWLSMARKLRLPIESLKATNPNVSELEAGMTVWYWSRKSLPSPR